MFHNQGKILSVETDPPNDAGTEHIKERCLWKGKGRADGAKCDDLSVNLWDPWKTQEGRASTGKVEQPTCNPSIWEAETEDLGPAG